MTIVAALRRFVCPRCGEAADAPGACRRDGEALADAEDDDLLGTELGGYRIAEEIGQGGMGAVYRAVQPTIDAEVAIKVLSRELIGERESSERFVSEARIANKVRHEGLVKVLQIGLTPDDRPYLIMEHLTGIPLSILIGAPLPLGTLLRRLAEVARAVGAMHDAGVIHRDLKPSNLFVTTAGFIKVLDFGIAKLADERSGLTRTGHTIGTPGYMSPEQAQADPIDHRSDIYSLGVVIYEAVVGRRPFEGRVVEAMVAHELPPALPDRMPRTLDAIVQRAMSPDPTARFSTVGDLATALDKVVETLPGDMFAPLLDTPLTVTIGPAFAVTSTLRAERAVTTTMLAHHPIKRLGRYGIEGTVGRGGEGVVLIARDPKVQRKVALKLLDADTGDHRARVIAEAQAMARVNHPNVVTLYELGEDGDQLFLAMEYLEAIDLERWLAEGTRPWREIVKMFVAAGHGLAAAHAVGVVHRDFKPANVLLGKDGRPRVGDFGIAEVGPSTHNASGTPAFMAPEQVEGGAVDARADQFAFCAALWLALHGEAPYAGGTALAIALAAQRDELRGPAHNVPSTITSVLRRGLAATPAARFPDMPALLAALEREPRRRWPGIAGAVVVSGALLAIVALREPAIEAPAPASGPTLGEIRAIPEPMDRLRAIAKLPVIERANLEVRTMARDAVAHGFVKKLQLDGDPLPEAAAFSIDGTLVVPVGDRVLAIDPAGKSRALPPPPRPPRRMFLDTRELRVLLDDQILATPLDRPAWQSIARCDYTGIRGRLAEANADLSMLACPGSSSKLVIDGQSSSIAIDRRDAVAFAPNRRVAVRRDMAIDVYDAHTTLVARREVIATQVAITDDLVAYIADGTLVLWDPATNAINATQMRADRVDLIGGAEPIALVTSSVGTAIAYVVRTPRLLVADVEASRSVPTRIAGRRVVESTASEVIVRDFGSGRAWRQRGAPGHVIADASGTRFAAFDGRALRLWTIEPLPAISTLGLLAFVADDLLIASAPGWTAPRAYDLRGTLLDELPANTRILPATNALLVMRDGKTLRWQPRIKLLREAADHELVAAIATGDELHENLDGVVVRTRDRTQSCPGPAFQTSTDGSTALVLTDGKLFACKLATKALMRIAISDDLESRSRNSRARWTVSRDGSRAAVIDEGRLALYDVRTGAAIGSPTAKLSVVDVAFARDHRLVVNAKEGLFLVDGDTIATLSTEPQHKDARFTPDGASIVAIARARVLVWSPPDLEPHELGLLAVPSDQRSALFAATGHAVARSLHALTGAAVVLPIAPPDQTVVEGWLARASEP